MAQFFSTACHRRASVLFTCGLVACWFVGCARSVAPRIATARADGLSQPSGPSDDGFVAAAQDLFASAPGTRQRALSLRAVENHQMARAEARFVARSVDGGLAALTGALYLVHTGEATESLLGPVGYAAVAEGARALAQRGDEGRSRGLYGLLFPRSVGSERVDIERHLSAIDAWTKALRLNEGAVASAGTDERIAVRRRLLEPSQAALEDAVRATNSWILQALALRDLFRRTRRPPSHDDGVEAWRAIETGPVVLASLYLRDGDVGHAFAAVESSSARALLESQRPQFASALAAAAKDGTLISCVGLLRQLRSLTGNDSSEDDEAFADERDLFGAAAFGLASECYRHDPSVPVAAFTLGHTLEDLGMSEVAPAVLVAAVRAHPDPRLVGEALDVSLRSLLAEEELGDIDAARHTFRAALPILTVASEPALRGVVRPTAARVRAAMGEVELREGHADVAHGLLARSADEERSADVLLSLAHIEARSGDLRSALGRLSSALTAPDADSDVALRGEVLLSRSDVLRAQGEQGQAREALTLALRELIDARGRMAGGALARVERVLARVLDHFGALGSADRALERAYTAAPSDKVQVSKTVGAALRRMLVRGDIASAHDWLRLAASADVDGDELIRDALWVRFIDRRHHAVPDGALERIFASAPEDRRWVSLLARYGEGRLKPDELGARATTPAQTSEGLLLLALDRIVSGDIASANDLLKKVLSRAGLSDALELVAMELLDPSLPRVASPLPPDVVIP